MPLRRSGSAESFCLPAAAEVLEVRALLSSAAGAAHAAVHHANLQTHAIAPLTFSSTHALGQIQINNGAATTIPVSGNLTASTLQLGVGSKVTVKVTFPPFGSPHPESVTATFTGTVASIDSGIGIQTFTINPTGGSLTLKGFFNNKSVTAKAFPDGTPWTIEVLTGGFRLISESFRFGPKTSGGLANAPVSLKVSV